jgi:hypothetical protein
MLGLERDGVIGRYAAGAVSMVGSISQFDELATEVAPRIAGEFTAMGADLELVVPFCPLCHVAFGILARAIEKRGIPDPGQFLPPWLCGRRGGRDRDDGGHGYSAFSTANPPSTLTT